MPWIRKANVHNCDLPMTSFSPAGSIGDVYRCDLCGELWRLGRACSACDRNGGHEHVGVHQIGRSWRPARWWQRIRYARS